MKTLIFVTSVVLAGMTGSCVVHGPGHHRVYGPAVTFEAGHVHSDHCGHYHHGGHWYQSRGHRHGPGCGHVHRGGMWIVID